MFLKIDRGKKNTIKKFVTLYYYINVYIMIIYD
jgi:hypothetical protein